MATTSLAADTAANGLVDELPTHTAETFRPILKALAVAAAVNPRDPTQAYDPSSSTGNLTDAQLAGLLEHLADANFTSSRENHAQIGSALTCLKFTRLDVRAETFALASRIFLDRSLKVSVPPLVPELAVSGLEYNGTLDLVGTGGDGHDTFNVSTTAAMVAAGVPGVRVCKHGAKASSSTSGSADLLLALGIPLITLPPTQMSKVLPRSKFSFLFAQLYHPALAPLGPIRRSLGFPTIFNVLGPLINPAKPERCILGVHSYYLGNIFAEALQKQGTERAWIVCGREGLDEISPEGPTDVWELKDGKITEFSISPSDFGLASHPLAHVGSHSAAENASVVLRLFTSATQPAGPLASPCPLEVPEGPSAPLARTLPPIPAGVRLDAVADYTILQAAALLYVGSYAPTLKDAAALARESMTGGGALRALDTFRSEANDAVERAEIIRQQEELRAAMKERRLSRDQMEATARKQDQYSYFPETYQDASVGTDDA